MSLMIDNRLNQQVRSEPMSDTEYQEYLYRRTYREGFGRAVDAFDQLACTPNEIALVQRLFDFYLYQLETWQHLPLTERIPPPVFAWQQPALTVLDDVGLGKTA